MKRTLRDRLVGPGDTLTGVARRALRVGLRTGMIGQVTLGGLARLARLSFDQPLGPGIVHALYARCFGDRDYIEYLRAFLFAEGDEQAEIDTSREGEVNW